MPFLPAHREALEALVRAHSTSQQLALRTRMILHAADNIGVREIGILMQRDPAVEEPGPLDMHGIGTIANVVRYVTAPDGAHHLVCQGDQRFRIIDFLETWRASPWQASRFARSFPVWRSILADE
jgi:Lon protease-like protein